MASEQQQLNMSFAAGADLSAKQFFAMKLGTTAGQIVIGAAAADYIIGILQNKPAAAGRAAELCTYGRTKAQVEATTDIAIGDLLGVHTDGRLIKRTTDKDMVCAIAEETATSVTGDVISVFFFDPRWLAV